jgi:hypothetical protein
MQRERYIFVLDLSDESVLAFEAESLIDADGLTREPWFTKALEEYRQSRLRTRTGLASTRVRTATEAEAALYQERAAEFAEAGNHFLVAHLAKR